MEKEEKYREILLEYYKQTMENCRTVGDQKFKILISIVISLGGILYALIRINDMDPSYSLNIITYPIILLFIVLIILSFWSLLFLRGHLPIINNIVIMIEELQRDILFKKMDIWYLFCWDEIPGNDNDIFRKFLIKNFNVKWVKRAKIEKDNDNRIIKVFTKNKFFKNKFFKNKFLSLELDYEKTIAILTIDNVKTDEFIVKTEEDMIKVYESELKHRFREIYPQLNAYHPSRKLEKMVIIIIFLLIITIGIFLFILTRFLSLLDFSLQLIILVNY